MNRLFLFALLFIVLSSCDDGDFDVPSFDFDGQTINHCNDSSLVLFKINDTEALVLETGIDNTDNVFFTTARENQSYTLSNNITYRIFSASVSSGYFCQDVPPSTPAINNEWTGSGTLLVTNVITDNGDGTSDYTTTFTITDMSLLNGDGNTIVFETFDFETTTGTFTN